MGRKLKPMKGLRFGWLTVTALEKIHPSGARWWCECDCGAKTLSWGSDLRSGRSTSCGCRGTGKGTRYFRSQQKLLWR